MDWLSDILLVGTFYVQNLKITNNGLKAKKIKNEELISEFY